jgi:ATP-dependent Lon protease
MPGRIIHNIKKVKTSNPVFILDEIDKLGRSAHGDPSSALLEVLDPEQNASFYDNFLEIEFDLSKVMFIATANTYTTIQPALLDRMEIIDVSGYVVEEKIEIAKRHLLPTQFANHGIDKYGIVLDDKVLSIIVENYTRESGVRELNNVLAKLSRAMARKIAGNEEFFNKITENFILEVLGKPKYSREAKDDENYSGVITGLAWTAHGGEILFIESSLSPGKGRISITGNLGDVMKESATLALSYIKSKSKELGIDDKLFAERDIHIHVPEGSIPKDGPSAGITMATSIASSFINKPVSTKFAMTGEITLRGKVLPVGGIKEKILAARRYGKSNVILSFDNEKDVSEIKDIYLKDMEFHFVRDVMDVFRLVKLI